MARVTTVSSSPYRVYTIMTTLAEELQTHHLLEDVCVALKRAARYSALNIEDDGRWCGELKSDSSITAKYITLLYAIGVPLPDTELWISWLLSQQHVDGSWALAPEIPGDISVTVETYLALRILGLDAQHPALRKAKDFALCSGGVARVCISTRVLLATFGLFPWTAVPELPPELILIPPSNPFSVCQMASWSRGTIIPLLLVRHHRPVFPLPNGRSESSTFLDELWCDPSHKQVPYSPSLWKPWKTDPVSFAFTAIDNLLHVANGLRGFSWRAGARAGCVSWILENLDQRAWGNILPPVHAGVLALVLEGYSVDSEPIRRGLEALEKLIWRDKLGCRIQPALSSVRDTVFMTIALLDASLPVEGGEKLLSRSVDWIKAQQHIRLPAESKSPGNINSTLREGGFSFGVSAKCAPDVGDTATAITALLKHSPHAITSAPVLLALKWILEMQNRDGGWGALDHENNRLFLNKPPFSDMDNMCDPSTADVTARVLEAFGLLIHPRPRFPSAKEEKPATLPPDLYNSVTGSASRAIAYLLSRQEDRGSWYGRWGANYIYGTGVALSGLTHFTSSPLPPFNKESHNIQASMAVASDWLVSVQNRDGGWGETLLTYHDPKLAGQGSASTPSQTAWALMGLLTTLPPHHSAIVRGVQYLVRAQKPVGTAASWPERLYTGTAFPKHLFLGYSLYSHYFPMMALGRYVSLVREKKGDGGIE